MTLALAGCRTQCSTIGNRFFAAAAPDVWNSLPEEVQSSTSLQLFWHCLKSELFRRFLGPRHSTWLYFLTVAWPCSFTCKPAFIYYYYYYYIIIIIIKQYQPVPWGCSGWLEIVNQGGNQVIRVNLENGHVMLSQLVCVAGICRLRLRHLDFSCNRIAHIPCDIRKVETLEDLSLSNNPLLSPPAAVSYTTCFIYGVPGWFCVLYDTKVSVVCTSGFLVILHFSEGDSLDLLFF